MAGQNHISVNADQIAFWNGQAGERWTRNQDQLDRGFAPLTAALLACAGARPGEAALDVGCGCGDVTLALAQAVGPAGRVLAVDVSAPMLAHAKTRAGSLPGDHAPITWALDDAATHAFPAGQCDLVASRFGVMFFADPAAAFANIRRALKPGGRLAMLCWRTPEENPWFGVPRAAVLPLVPPPEPVPAGAPGPFAFADSAHVEVILTKAGFAGIEAGRFDAELVVGEASAGSDAEALANATRFSLEVGPVGSMLREAPEETIAAARVAVEAALRPYVAQGRVKLRVGCWLYTATSG